MSDNVLILTDLHVHPHKRKIERLEDCLKVLDWAFQTARDHHIDTILFGGDLLHDRVKIEVYTYQRLFETLKRNLTNNIQLYLLLGNHDLWFNENTSISSVVPFSSLPNVKIIDKPTRIPNLGGGTWDFIPFTHDPLTALQELKNMPGQAQYCLGHVAIDGAILHGSHISDVAVEHDGDMVKVDAALFSHYKSVILGHYHCPQKINDVVEYLGSPLELSFGEANQKKNILILNGKTGEKTYIENTFSPKHLIVHQKDLEKYDLNGNFVWLIADAESGATDIIKIRKDITDNNQLASLQIKNAKIKNEEHIVKDAKAILFKENEMLVRYVDEVGTDNLDRGFLLQIGKEIYEESLAV